MRSTRLTLAGLAALIVTTGQALAGTTATYPITGSVTSVCTAGTGSAFAYGKLTNDTTGATTITAPGAITDNSAFCNQAGTTVMVQHSNLVTAAGSSSGFTSALPIASVSVKSAQNSTGVTDSTAPTGTNGVSLSSGTTTSTGSFGAFSNLIVSLTSGSPTGFLVASATYSGSVQITLAPGG